MDGYIGQIILFAGNYAPDNWRLCDGSLLQIAEYSALFSLIGTTYGGDGEEIFALPDLRGRAPICDGMTSNGAYQLGQTLGSPNVTLTGAQLPLHNHFFEATSAPAVTTDPTGNLLATVPAGRVFYNAPQPPNPTAFASGALAPAGSNQAHDNHMPSLAVSYLICVEGVYPSFY